MVSAPLPGNGGVAVAGRYSYTAALVGLLNENVRVEYWDYQLRADRRVGAFQLTLLVFGSNDVLVPDQSDTVDEVNLGFHRVSLRAAAPLGGGRVQGSIALGSDHTRAPLLETFPITIDAISAAPRLAFLRSFGPPRTSRSASTASWRATIRSSSAPLHPPSDWDLAQRRDAYPARRLRLGDTARGPAVRADARAPLRQLRRQRRARAGPGAAVGRTGRPARRHGAAGDGRPLHPAPQPALADPGRGRVRLAPARASELVAGLGGRRDEPPPGDRARRHRLHPALYADRRARFAAERSRSARQRLPGQARRGVLRHRAARPPAAVAPALRLDRLHAVQQPAVVRRRRRRPVRLGPAPRLQRRRRLPLGPHHPRRPRPLQHRPAVHHLRLPIWRRDRILSAPAGLLSARPTDRSPLRLRQVRSQFLSSSW